MVAIFFHLAFLTRFIFFCYCRFWLFYISTRFTKYRSLILSSRALLPLGARGPMYPVVYKVISTLNDRYGSPRGKCLFRSDEFCVLT